MWNMSDVSLTNDIKSVRNNIPVTKYKPQSVFSSDFLYLKNLVKIETVFSKTNLAKRELQQILQQFCEHILSGGKGLDRL